MGKSYVLIFFCSQLLVYKSFLGKSYVFIFSIGSCWYTKILWPRVIFSFFLLAVIGIQSFYGQELSSHFFCWQLLVYKVITGKSYLLIFSVGSCWYTKFLWARVMFSFFLFAVVGIQSFYGQELRSHFSCWQLLVYKFFVSKSYVLIFPVGSCWYTNFSWPGVIFSFFLLVVVGIQSFYGQELRSHIFLFAVVGIQKFFGQELRFHFFHWQLLVYKDFMA